MEIDVPEKYIAPLPKHLPLSGLHIVVDDPYLTPGEAGFLLKYPVRITEKLDGERVAIRVGRFVLTAEDMLVRKTIFYQIPARYAVYDICDCKRGFFLLSYGIRSVMQDLTNGVLKSDNVSPDMFFPAPFISEVQLKLESIPDFLGESIYGRDETTGRPVQAMGIVVKTDVEQIPWMYFAGMVLASEVRGDFDDYQQTRISAENLIDPSIAFAW